MNHECPILPDNPTYLISPYFISYMRLQCIFWGLTNAAQRTYLQFAGSLVITVDLQQVIDIYLYLGHLLLLEHKDTLVYWAAQAEELVEDEHINMWRSK